MTSRFILDLRQAADPRFNDLSTGGGGISTLIFPAASTHASCFDSHPSLGASTADTDWLDQNSENGRSAGAGVAECDDAESEVSLSLHGIAAPP
ncbi:hypothetical protein TRAPUB_9165 [Trametes pubescens]|uniref:Uncharacterized protein n=1 Tax=Trametes pubescens TaxID=154538 RepID=A0A1M2W369_TRAPU|nr:hypothetical protein TRAPUB_9165 [Trametes pubescens]